MRFSVAATAALVAGASAHYKRPSSNDTDVSYTTEVVTQLTTVCPGPTEIAHNGKTYTVTSATTLTITDCPCTVTKPVTTTTPAAPTGYPSSSSPAGYSSSSASTAAPVPSSSSPSSYSSAAPVPSSSSAPSAYPSSSAPASYPTTAAPVPSYPAGNATTPVVKPTGASPSAPAAYTGAANKLAGAGLAAVFGLAALAL